MYAPAFTTALGEQIVVPGQRLWPSMKATHSRRISAGCMTIQLFWLYLIMTFDDWQK